MHRVGQPNAVNVYYLLSDQSLDLLLWPLVQAKLAVLSKALDGR